MEEIAKQLITVLLTYGPGGVVAILAIGWGLSERKDRKEAQDKLEKALIDWNTDSKAQGDKSAAIAEKSAVLLDQVRAVLAERRGR